MDNYKSLEYIRSKVPTAELYAALAEEAAELAQAALKYRRTIIKDSPTPKTEEEALQSLLEELADINTCLTAINFTSEQHVKIREIEQKKQTGGHKDLWKRNLINNNRKLTGANKQ